jgi:hypothetical protein
MRGQQRKHIRTNDDATDTGCPYPEGGLDIKVLANKMSITARDGGENNGKERRADGDGCWIAQPEMNGRQHDTATTGANQAA